MDHQNNCCSCFSDKGSQEPCTHCGWAEGSAPESALHLPPGAVLEGKYIIGRALGHFNAHPNIASVRDFFRPMVPPTWL